MFGFMGCAASPRSVTRPRPQLRRGGRSYVNVGSITSGSVDSISPGMGENQAPERGGNCPRGRGGGGQATDTGAILAAPGKETRAGSASATSLNADYSPDASQGATWAERAFGYADGRLYEPFDPD